jgi:hypothetical protein
LKAGNACSFQGVEAAAVLSVDSLFWGALPRDKIFAAQWPPCFDLRRDGRAADDESCYKGRRTTSKVAIADIKTDMLQRPFWFGLGVLALALGALGVVLPLLPATPFILVAAFAFARSSPRVHRWLLAHRRFGPLIVNWRRHGAIARGAKRLALIVMGSTFAASALLGAGPVVLVLQAIFLGGAAIFVGTRPLPPGEA